MRAGALMRAGAPVPNSALHHSPPDGGHRPDGNRVRNGHHIL